MFTRIAKGLLGILVVAVLFLAVIITVVADGGFLLFIGVLLFGGIFLFSYGMFVELTNNIMDIKEILAKTYIANYDLIDTIASSNETPARIKKQIIIDDKWVCNKCGTKNQLDTTWCTFCGKQTREKD